MTDILERLRGSRTPQGGLWPYPNLHDEAAAEIERLKAIASKAIREQIPMREEIDSLKAQLEPFRTFASAEVIHALRAENAKLRELLIEARDWIDKGESGWMAFAAQIDAATKEE